MFARVLRPLEPSIARAGLQCCTNAGANHPGLNPNLRQPVQTNCCPNVNSRTPDGPAPVCKTFALPQTMVSPERPDCRFDLAMADLQQVVVKSTDIVRKRACPSPPKDSPDL